MSAAKTVHLIGICGTGMASLAGLLKSRGFSVRGSDENVYPPMSTMLDSLEIPVMKGYRPENLDPAPDLVVVGNVVGKANREAAAVLHRGLPYLSMPQALGEYLLAGRHPVVVTGTHGKTTTSALMSHVLVSSGRNPSWFVGGVMLGDDRSFNLGTGEHVIIEVTPTKINAMNGHAAVNPMQLLAMRALRRLGL